MLKTVEAEIDVDGNVKLLESVRVRKTTRAIGTLLEDSNGNQEHRGSSRQLLELLHSHEFAKRKSYPAAEIEAQLKKRGMLGNEHIRDLFSSCRAGESHRSFPSRMNHDKINSL